MRPKFFPDHVLPYPSGNLSAEVVLLFVFIPVEAARLFFGEQSKQKWTHTHSTALPS